MLTNKQIYGGKPATVEIKNRETGEVVYHSHRSEDTVKTLLERILEIGGPRWLPNCDLSKVCLEGAVLKNADFRRVDFTGTDFTEANLMLSRFQRAVMLDVNLTRAEMHGADLRDVEFRPVAGTWDPEFSLGMRPFRGFSQQLAEAYLKQKARHPIPLSSLAVKIGGALAWNIRTLTSPSMAAAILAPEAAHLYMTPADAQAAWCEQVLKGRKGRVKA